MVVVLVATIAGWWNGTSGAVILNTEAVERSIEHSILTQRHLPATASCPDNIVQKAGVVFYCYATVRHTRYPVMVTETDGNGHVTYVVT